MKQQRLRRIAACALAATFAATGAAAGTLQGKVGPNIINNSGFESGLSGWATSGFVLQGFDYGIDAQAHSGSSAFYGGAIGGLGFLSQSVPTVQGTAYNLSLWLLSDGFLPNELTVSTGGTLRLDRTDILIGPYSLVSLTFYATGPTTSLQLGFRNDSGYLHVDDINVNLAPEPATLALLELGVALVAARRRKPRIA